MKKKFLWARKSHYLVRHLRTVLPHLTVRKLFNLGLNLIEYSLAIDKLHSLPPYLKIDPTPRCQLACPTCAHSERDFKKQFNSSMDLSTENLEKIVYPLRKHLLGVSLSLTGEPFINRSLIDCIKVINSMNVAVSLPSNFSIRFEDEQLEDLVRSGLDALYVSLDGASPETYQLFRRGGDFELVLENVRKLADAKKKLNKSRPRVIWKYIEFEHNRHETGKVAETYRDLGFDDYEINMNHHADEAQDAESEMKKTIVDNDKPCFWAWHTTVVSWTGEVRACCERSGNFKLGNAFTENLGDLWRSPEYTALRSGFRKNKSKMNPICKACLGLIPENEADSLYPLLDLRRQETK